LPSQFLGKLANEGSTTWKVSIPPSLGFSANSALLASLLLFGLFLVELASLHRFTLYDLMVYDWMQQYRSALSIAPRHF
jgi:hypothetical protein